MFILKYRISKAIAVTDRGGLQGCEVSRITHCLDNRLTDGGKVVSLTHRPQYRRWKYFLLGFDIDLCWRLSKQNGIMLLEESAKLIKRSLTSAGLEPATFQLVA
jgi:hypothetical protein